MYKTIIAPIDINSKNSWPLGIKIAENMARKFESNIHFLNVVPDYGLGMIQQYFPKGWVNEVIEKSKIELKRIVESVLTDDIKYEINVSRGAVYQVIIDLAIKIRADLIIMAAHHPNRSDYLLGPNTAKVVRHSNISVLVAREPVLTTTESI